MSLDIFCAPFYFDSQTNQMHFVYQSNTGICRLVIVHTLCFKFYTLISILFLKFDRNQSCDWTNNEKAGEHRAR